MTISLSFAAAVAFSCIVPTCNPVTACEPATMKPPKWEPPKWREMLPHPSVFRMANQARAVIEGTTTKEGVVTVTKRWLVQPGDQIGATITVPALAKIRKTRGLGVRMAKGRPLKPLQSNKVLLFLADNPEGAVWVPMHLIGRGARGVIWEAKGDPWGYSQSMNPGTYRLARWAMARVGRPVLANMVGLRAELTAGLAARERWQAALAIADRDERAKELVKWFSPETSPDGGWWRERTWPDLMKACDELGEAMVKPLARIVKASESAPAVTSAADALGRLGHKGRGGAPALIARLRGLRGAKPIFLVRSLHRLADPRAVAVLRDFVAHEDLFVASEAAMAMHASGGEGSFELLVKRMPAAIDTPAQRGVVAQMLEFLHKHKPELAEKLVVERYLDCSQLMMQRPWLRRLAREHK